MTRGQIMDDMAVDLPEGKYGLCSIQRFTVEPFSLENLRLSMFGRDCAPGTYTKLTRNGTLWMSDTTAERMDHLEPARAIRSQGGRVLLGGLGLGMILRVALTTPTVEHVDVVELNADVIALVGPTYQRMADERGISLVIHEADLFAKRWPPHTRWNVAWFDVWSDVSTDVLPEMARLRRSYGRRTDWNDCWARRDLLRRQRQERRSCYW